MSIAVALTTITSVLSLIKQIKEGIDLGINVYEDLKRPVELLRAITKDGPPSPEKMAEIRAETDAIRARNRMPLPEPEPGEAP